MKLKNLRMDETLATTTSRGQTSDTVMLEHAEFSQ